MSSHIKFQLPIRYKLRLVLHDSKSLKRVNINKFCLLVPDEGIFPNHLLCSVPKLRYKPAIFFIKSFSIG